MSVVTVTCTTGIRTTLEPCTCLTTAGVPGGWGSGHLLLLLLEKLQFLLLSPVLRFTSYKFRCLHLSIPSKCRSFCNFDSAARRAAPAFELWQLCLASWKTDLTLLCHGCHLYSWLASSQLKTQERPDQVT